jgi:hypothetical protein
MGTFKKFFFLLLISGFFFLETHYSQQIENALNRDQTNLIDAINLYKSEKYSTKILFLYLNKF